MGDTWDSRTRPCPEATTTPGQRLQPRHPQRLSDDQGLSPTSPSGSVRWCLISASISVAHHGQALQWTVQRPPQAGGLWGPGEGCSAVAPPGTHPPPPRVEPEPMGAPSTGWWGRTPLPSRPAHLDPPPVSLPLPWPVAWPDRLSPQCLLMGLPRPLLLAAAGAAGQL